MTAISKTILSGGHGPRLSSGFVLVCVFTVSIFLSATLLFSVQPLFAKLALPLLGGASNVWNTAMVFFQATLLLGYIYAHLISKYAPLYLQIIIHILTMTLGLLFLPLAIASGWTPPEQGAQSFWLITLFAVSIGVPFFAISANAPLLQHWFSRTGHKNAEDPYFLYAASNVGSLLSLCSYPLLFEPMMRLREQTSLWSAGYIALMLALLLAGILAFQQRHRTPLTSNVTTQAKSISPPQRLRWIFWAFVPSSLMLGVTSYMTNNIASSPFLWVGPLALYLITFIIVFASKPIVSEAQLRKYIRTVVLLAILSGFVLKVFIILSIVLTLLCYFLIALMFHSRLAEDRPEAARLTEFYIFMSLGGVLGGVFNALISPILFNGVYEYILVLILAFQGLPKDKEDTLSQLKRAGLLILAALIAIFLYNTLNRTDLPFVAAVFGGGLVFVFALSLVQDDRRFIVINVAVLIIGSFFLSPFLQGFSGQTVLQERTFFGVISVKSQTSEYGIVHRFDHGDTIHNYQLRDPALQKIPLAYYAKDNTFDRALKAIRTQKPAINMAMIGLGAGAMACYEQPGDQWTYFEINPSVVDMALDPELFSYLSKCSFDSDIRIGDARLTLAKLPNGSLDVIMVDAFSSDAIPTHLVTREAMALYVEKLKTDGFIFFHTSNRVMDISSVVVRLADDAELGSRYLELTDFQNTPFSKFIMPSTGVLIGPEQSLATMVLGDKNWTEFAPSHRVKTWSDDYSSVLDTILAKREQREKDEVESLKNNDGAQ